MHSKIDPADGVRPYSLGRYGAFEVIEIDDDVPNLLGQIPLEYHDLVVDPKCRLAEGTRRCAGRCL